VVEMMDHVAGDVAVHPKLIHPKRNVEDVLVIAAGLTQALVVEMMDHVAMIVVVMVVVVVVVILLLIQ